MAWEHEMSASFYVIDTSYLLELFRVPTFSTVSSIERIGHKFESAVKNKDIMFVPSPCLFELGNHITDVNDAGIRRKLQEQFHDTIQKALSDTIPFTILFMNDINAEKRFLELCFDFVGKYADENIGLTDTCVISEANRLKKKRHGFDYKVHIWTKDKRLKAHEPDKEEDAFLG
jgi:hypothetical protein